MCLESEQFRKRQQTKQERSKLHEERSGLQNLSDLTVRLLEPGACASATELLGLTSAGVGDQKGAIIADEDVLDFLLGLLVHVLLVEGNEGLGDALTDGINLGGLAAAADADADVDVHEPLPPEEEDGLEGLKAEDLRLHQFDRHAVHLDQSTTPLAVRHSHRRLLPSEALHRVHWCRRHRQRSSSPRDERDETLKFDRRVGESTTYIAESTRNQEAV
ncbi:unnamed protein product [Musa acuminata var. zebrina]